MKAKSFIEVQKRQVSLNSAEDLSNDQSTEKFSKNIWVGSISTEQFVSHMKNAVPHPPYD